MQWLRQSWIGVLFAVAVLVFAFTDFGKSDEEPVLDIPEEGFQNPDGTVAEQPVPPYARTGWSTLHADERNSRYVPTRVGTAFSRGWGALGDTPVPSAPVVGPEGHVYVTTGLGPGESNLHAYDLGGSLLWQSAPWKKRVVSGGDEFIPATTTVDTVEGGREGVASQRSTTSNTSAERDTSVLGGPDSCAILQSPIIDDAGDLYLSDCDQLWAYHADGSVKWVVELPSAPLGSPYQIDRNVPLNPFVVAAFTVDGAVLGVTTSGQVIAYDRQTGVSLMVPFLLPSPQLASGGVASQPPGFWSSVEIDPEIVQPAWEVFSGQRFPSTNTPAIGPDGTIYISASTDISNDGGLYAFEFDPLGATHEPGSDGPPGALNEVWETSVGPGARSTPVVSHDGELIYLTDIDGGVWAVGSEQGTIEWKVEGDAISTSVTAGPDGRLYVLGADGNLSALSSTGEQLWTVSMEQAATKGLPEIENLEGPRATVRGQPTLTRDGLVVGVEVEYRLSRSGEVFRLPVRAENLLLDNETGDVIRELASQLGEPTGAVFTSLSGAMLVHHGCINTGQAAATDDITGFILAGAKLEPLELGCGIEMFRSKPPEQIDDTER